MRGGRPPRPVFFNIKEDLKDKTVKKWSESISIYGDPTAENARFGKYLQPERSQEDQLIAKISQNGPARGSLARTLLLLRNLNEIFLLNNPYNF